MDCSSQQNRGAFQPWVISRSILRGEVRRKPRSRTGRPYLIKQLGAGKLAFHMVGTHRRLKLADVLAYRDRTDADASDALDALIAEAEDLGLYEQ